MRKLCRSERVGGRVQVNLFCVHRVVKALFPFRKQNYFSVIQYYHVPRLTSITIVCISWRNNNLKKNICSL